MEAETDFRDQNKDAAAVQKANFESLDKTFQQFITALLMVILMSQILSSLKMQQRDS
jgi:hypothetical protein